MVAGAELIVRSQSDATAASTPSDNEERLCSRTRPHRVAPRLSLSLVSPRLSSAPPRLARVRSDSASKRHETLRQIRNAEIYMRARSNMLRICVTIQH